MIKEFMLIFNKEIGMAQHLWVIMVLSKYYKNLKLKYKDYN